MKYVVLADKHGEETIHTWTRNDLLTHKDMADAIQKISVGGDYFKPLLSSKVVAAGFIGDNGECYGFSHSLGVQSRGEQDTELLRG